MRSRAALRGTGALAPCVVTLALVAGAVAGAGGIPVTAQPSPQGGLFELSEGGEVCPSAALVLAALPGGGFVAAWIEGDRLRVRRFDRFGAVRLRDPVSRVLPEDTPRPELAIASTASGAFAVAWRESEAVQVWRFTAAGNDQGVESIAAPDGPGPVALTAVGEGVEGGTYLLAWTEGEDEDTVVKGLDLSTLTPLGPLELEGDRPAWLELAVQPNGDLWALYRVSVVVTPDPLITRGRWLPADAPEEPRLFFDHFGVRAHALARDAGGGAVVAWVGESLEDPVGGSVDFSYGVRFVRFDASAEPVGTSVEARPDPPEGTRVFGPDLTADGVGNLSLVWSEVGEVPLESSRSRSFGPDDRPLGPVQPVFSGVPAVLGQCSGGDTPTVVGSGPGEMAFVHWRCVEPPPGSGSPLPCQTHRLEGRRGQVAAGRTLLLGDGRFLVTVDWQDPFNGGSGRGHAIQETADTGGFWFFDPANQELTVKVLDARTVNGHFWFFYGALSNVAYQITVTDQVTGDHQTYENPPRRFGSFADNFAFPAP